MNFLPPTEKAILVKASYKNHNIHSVLSWGMIAALVLFCSNWYHSPWCPPWLFNVLLQCRHLPIYFAMAYIRSTCLSFVDKGPGPCEGASLRASLQCQECIEEKSIEACNANGVWNTCQQKDVRNVVSLYKYISCLVKSCVKIHLTRRVFHSVLTKYTITRQWHFDVIHVS